MHANLFVGFVGKQIVEQYTDPIPECLGWYIDDCHPSGINERFSYV
jgi:hypothetical protein